MPNIQFTYVNGQYMMQAKSEFAMHPSLAIGLPPDL